MIDEDDLNSREEFLDDGSHEYCLEKQLVSFLLCAFLYVIHFTHLSVLRDSFTL